MVSKKYVNDYKIDLDYNPLTKRQKMTAHYVGPRFFFADRDKAAAAKILFTVVSLVIEACYWTMLFVESPCGHIWYVMIPLVFMMLPMIFRFAFLYRLLTAVRDVTREHRDKIVDRFAVVNTGTIILSALSLAGHVVFSFRYSDTGTDVLFYILTSVILLLAVWLFVVRYRIDMVMTEEASAEASNNKKIQEEKR